MLSAHDIGVPHLCNVRASSSALLSMKRSGSLASTRKTMPEDSISSRARRQTEALFKYRKPRGSTVWGQSVFEANKCVLTATHVLPQTSCLLVTCFLSQLCVSRSSFCQVCVPPKSKVVKRTLPMLSSSEAVCCVSHVRMRCVRWALKRTRVESGVQDGAVDCKLD